MKRMHLALSVVVLLIMLLTACAGESIDITGLKKSEYDAAQQSTEVTMTIQSATINARTESIDLLFINQSQNEYSFGMEPRLEAESGGVWYVAPLEEDAAWIEIALLLPAGKTTEYDFPLQAFYGTLLPGHYRIVKPLYSDAGNTFVLAEFTIK